MHDTKSEQPGQPFPFTCRACGLFTVLRRFSPPAFDHHVSNRGVCPVCPVCNFEYVKPKGMHFDWDTSSGIVFFECENKHKFEWMFEFDKGNTYLHVVQGMPRRD